MKSSEIITWAYYFFPFTWLFCVISIVFHCLHNNKNTVSQPLYLWCLTTSLCMAHVWSLLQVKIALKWYSNTREGYIWTVWRLRLGFNFGLMLKHLNKNRRIDKQSNFFCSMSPAVKFQSQTSITVKIVPVSVSHRFSWDERTKSSVVWRLRLWLGVEFFWETIAMHLHWDKDSRHFHQVLIHLFCLVDLVNHAPFTTSQLTY